MRTRIIASLCLLLGAGQALAQEEEDTGTEAAEEQSGETEGAEVVEEGDRVRMTPPGQGEGRTSAPGEVHTVVPGDTLWDLSQSYLGSPWYWPKVWSYNPEIANPHWIYPGNKVRFFPSGEEVPSRVEVGGAPEMIADDTSDIDAPSAFEDDMGSVTAAGRIGYVPGRQARLLLQGFVTARELEEAGTIAGSFAETEMLSNPDTVYIKFKQKGSARLGDQYVIFKTVKDVHHPNGGKIGYLTHFLGKVRVVRISDEIVTAQITDTWDEIHRGDLIGPANEDLRLAVAPRANEKELTGTIVELMIPYLTMAGEHQLVIIDRGSSDGVQVGNSFHVIRQQEMGGNLMEPQKNQDKRWPVEKIAACMVVDVKDKASTCLMTRSIREVLRGDQLLMQPDAQPTAALQ